MRLEASSNLLQKKLEAVSGTLHRKREDALVRAAIGLVASATLAPDDDINWLASEDAGGRD